ncbi:hypothetical protein C2G38_2227218 [Gigaspora rosea]|uniref:Uncharacterized protein n=1 Tax=Gigaspora rosea TaxID=44941 RepID=A0A397TX95_9GLOM|nr:hypothetical protein C2G38_2227218 [Gigaspora rosea]
MEHENTDTPKNKDSYLAVLFKNINNSEFLCSDNGRLLTNEDNTTKRLSSEQKSIRLRFHLTMKKYLLFHLMFKFNPAQHKKLDPKSDQFNSISKRIIGNQFYKLRNSGIDEKHYSTLTYCRFNRIISDLFIKRKAKALSFQPYYQFYNSSSVIENIYSHLTFEYKSLRTKMNDISSLLQVREIKSDNEEQVQSLEYQPVFETINTKESELFIELSDRKSIDLCKNDPKYEVVNADYEDYIFYRKVKYPIDEFLENQQNEIKSLTKNTRLLNDYLSNKYRDIREDILALQNDIEDLEIRYLKIEFGEY